MVDGAGANVGISSGLFLEQTGAGTTPPVSALGGTNSLVSVDTLQEFRIQTSTYAPEFGRTPGGQVSIITRSGTNEFHGTAFNYFRNEALDANDWFANSRNLSKPPLRQNDFGGVLGGPIVRNRNFFFFSYEGLRLRLPQVALSIVPSLSLRQNAPPQIQPLLNVFPVPNGQDFGNGLAEFNASFSNPSTVNALIVAFNTLNDLLAARASRATVTANRGRLYPLFTNFSAYGQDSWRLGHRLTLTYGVRWELNPAPREANGDGPFTVLGLDNPATMTSSAARYAVFRNYLRQLRAACRSRLSVVRIARPRDSAARWLRHLLRSWDWHYLDGVLRR